MDLAIFIIGLGTGLFAALYLFHKFVWPLIKAFHALVTAISK